MISLTTVLSCGLERHHKVGVRVQMMTEVHLHKYHNFPSLPSIPTCLLRTIYNLDNKDRDANVAVDLA
jgi:hypothetical protein